MERPFSLTINNQQGTKDHKTFKDFLIDLKLLTKRIVLVANVFPVVTAFWLSVYFADLSFGDHLHTLLLTVFGSTFVIAGALMLNNWYEVDLDREMTRTQKRPTVTGSIPLPIVLWMGIASSIIGFILMLFTTMEATIYAFLGWFTYVVLYTFWSKRKYTLNTVIGSISGAFTPLIGWAAVQPSLHIVPLVLFLILFIWQIPHTFAIAVRREKEYKAAGVPMLPVIYGIDMTKRQTMIYVLCLLPLPLFLGSLGGFFLVCAMVMNVVWIIITVRGLFIDDHLKWAQTNFIYSLSYLAILFVLMILVTLPIFH